MGLTDLFTQVKLKVQRTVVWFVALSLLSVLGLAAAAQSDQALWQQLRSGGHVLLIRHADAPGTFDPPGFQLADCATQRNLSAKGREQAKRIGEQLAQAQVPVGTVFSSQWCRCVDTATLAFSASKVMTRPELSSPTQLSAERRAANHGSRHHQWPHRSAGSLDLFDVLEESL